MAQRLIQKMVQQLVKKICANPECRRAFTGAPNARYCSSSCRLRAFRVRRALAKGLPIPPHRQHRGSGAVVYGGTVRENRIRELRLTRAQADEIERQLDLPAEERFRLSQKWTVAERTYAKRVYSARYRVNSIHSLEEY